MPRHSAPFLRLAVVMVLVSCDGALAKDLSALGLKSNQASKRDAGSAPRLSGSTLIYHAFVADDTSSWSEGERAQVRQNVKESLEFIVREARRFGVKVAFREDDAQEVYFAGVAPTSTFVDPLWTEVVIQSIHERSGNQLVAELQHKHQVDNVVFCLHVNKPALSYNLAYYDGVASTYLAERMICFTRYPDGRPTAAATYAHEILHLFGAGDLYFPYDKGNRRKDRARRQFPDGIMRRVDYDISRLNVGAFTAYRVGWLDDLEPRFQVYED